MNKILQIRVRLGILLLCLLLQSCMSAKMSQDLQLGKITFESGDYTLAFNRLLPVAANGNPEAEYAIGYMYFYGYGTTQDQSVGLFWIKRAAEKGYPPAIMALDKIYHANKPTKRKPRPVFVNGVPQMSKANDIRDAIKHFPNAKILTKADLPIVKNPPSAGSLRFPEENTKERLSQDAEHNKPTFPSYDDIPFRAELVKAPLSFLACEQIPLKAAYLQERTPLLSKTTYTPWVQSILV